jgi:hypothetical protein
MHGMSFIQWNPVWMTDVLKGGSTTSTDVNQSPSYFSGKKKPHKGQNTACMSPFG